MTTKLPRKPARIVTVEYVRERLSYCAETGLFVWAISTGAGAAGSAAGTRHARGYLDIGIGGRRYGAHRLAWLLMTGEWPKGEIDHRNGDKSDNRISNLRDATHAMNTQNIRAANRRNASGLLGVRRSDSKAVRFNAVIMVQGKVKCLGTFDTPDAAHEAYLTAKRALHEGCTI